MPSNHSYALVTGASSGIGLELARCAAAAGCDLLLAADEAKIQSVAADFTAQGIETSAIEVDLSSTSAVEQLYAAAKGRPIDFLLANASRGLGGAFLDQDLDRVRRVIDTNIVGTLELVHRVGRDMRDRGRGRILISGSIAGLTPGTYQAAYNGTKAFLDSFAYALRAELKSTGVTVTCLMAGATEIEFFERAEMTTVKFGTEQKQPPDQVAKAGFEAMLRGEGEVVTGWSNKLRAAISHIVPRETLADAQRKVAVPGTSVKH